MKKNLFISFAFLLSTASAWADPVGTWEISMKGPGGTQTNLLTIRKEGQSHYASLATPQGEAEIGEIQVDGDHFEFSFSRTAGTYTLNFSYDGDVEGDTMKGNATTSRGTMPFSGTRQ